MSAWTRTRTWERAAVPLVMTFGLIVACCLALVPWAGQDQLQLDAYHRPAQSYCGLGSTGIDIIGRVLHEITLSSGDYATGHYSFFVNCPPLEGTLRLQLEEYHPKAGIWVSEAEKRKNAADTTHGEYFTMVVTARCGGKLSWRLRLGISAGVAGDGTKTPPDVDFYPSRDGKQLNCRGAHSG